MTESLTAIFIAVFWCVVALLIAWSRGYSPLGIAMCIGGIVAGGALAGWAGSYALSAGWNSVSTEDRTTVVACAAVLLGAMCGLYLAERIRDRRFPTSRQLLTAMFGFLFGGSAGFLILFIARNTWSEKLATFVLMPATLASAMVAGSAISHRPIELR